MSSSGLKGLFERIMSAFTGRHAVSDEPARLLPPAAPDFWDLVAAALQQQGEVLYPVATKPQPADRFWNAHAELPGCQYWMMLDQFEASVGFNMDRASRSENKQVFDYLYANKGSIERIFESVMIWERLDEHQASRLRFAKAFDDVYDPQSWELVASWLVQHSIKLERALGAALRDFVQSNSGAVLLQQPAVAASPASVPVAKLAGGGQRMAQLRLAFWQTTLATLQEKGVALYKKTKPSKSQFLSTKSGLQGCRYWLTFSNSEIRVELNIDREDKTENKQIFDYLYSQQAKIEQAFGIGLVWDRLEQKQACKIRYCQPVQGGYDHTYWPAMTTWLATHIVRLERSFKDVLLDYQQLERSSTTQADAGLKNKKHSVPQLRQAFWAEVLAALRLESISLYRHVSPAKVNFLSSKSVLKGCRYWMTLGQSEVRVELNIACEDKIDNESIFTHLLEHQKAIEQVFQEKLIWDKLPGKKVSKLRAQKFFNNGHDRAEWPAMIAWLVANIVRLEQATKPALVELVEAERAKLEEQADLEQAAQQEQPGQPAKAEQQQKQGPAQAAQTKQPKPVSTAKKVAGKPTKAPQQNLPLPKLRLAFWQQLIPELRPLNKDYAALKPIKAATLSLPTGLSGCHYGLVFSRSEVRVELNFDHQQKAVFDYLQSHSEQIEKAFKAKLMWVSGNNAKLFFATKVKAGHSAAEWPTMIAWLVTRLDQLQQATNDLLLTGQKRHQLTNTR